MMPITKLLCESCGKEQTGLFHQYKSRIFCDLRCYIRMNMEKDKEFMCSLSIVGHSIGEYK